VNHSIAWTAGVSGAVLVAWAGFFVHNVVELPGQSLLSPESLVPTMVWFALLIVWLIPATRPGGAWGLLAWAVINAVGGVLSVLPLAILPFQPPQTLEHYALHLLYFAAQLPLILLTAVWIRRRARDRAQEVAH
jgi:hypothetical protein